MKRLNQPESATRVPARQQASPTYQKPARLDSTAIVNTGSAGSERTVAELQRRTACRSGALVLARVHQELPDRVALRVDLLDLVGELRLLHQAELRHPAPAGRVANPDYSYPMRETVFERGVTG